RTIGAGTGAGGWTTPSVTAPEQMTPCIMCAVGGPSINVGCGSNPAGSGLVAPAGATRSCVIGSPIRQAGPGGIGSPYGFGADLKPLAESSAAAGSSGLRVLVPTFGPGATGTGGVGGNGRAMLPGQLIFVSVPKTVTPVA